MDTPMMQRWLGFTMLAASLTNCAVSRAYTLPVQPEQSSQVMTGLVQCAHNQGYASNRSEDVFNVAVNAKMHVSFQMDENQQLAMAVLLDNSTPATEQENLFTEGKQVGDNLLSCAQQHEATTPAAPTVGQAAPSSSGHADVCKQLQTCYNELAKALCKQHQDDCQHQFELHPDHNHMVCTQLMVAIPTTIVPFKAAYPNFVMPNSCMQHSNVTAVDAAMPNNPSSSQNPSSKPGKGSKANAPSHHMDQSNNWQGNWMLKANYQWTCQYASTQPEKGKDVGNWSLQIQGQGNQMEGIISASGQEYRLKGSQSSQGLRLCGAFPFKGKGGNMAPTKENNVCLTISQPEDSQEQTVGVAEGDFETRFGHKCKVADVQIQLSR